MRTSIGLLACCAAVVAPIASAQMIAAPPPDDEANPPSTLYRQIGNVTPRSSTELAAAGIGSLFSIGTEQTDRGYSTFSKWSSYLPWLGIPAARVQTGWANVEPTPGSYDFSRLDEIYDGMAAVSVKPWMNLVYGNPAYPGGGTITASSALPRSDTTARAAWLAFVRATVAHFNTPTRMVTEWEIWNEPNHQGIGAVSYANFAVETAQAIKSVQPNAKIIIGGLAGFSASTYFQPMLDTFDANKGPMIAAADVEVSYHPYDKNPDNYGNSYFALRNAVLAKGYTIRQGENGAPSVDQEEAALNDVPWTPTRQAKWNLRRLLGDFYRGIPSSLFTITDTHMPGFINSKGLLKTVGAASSTPPTYGDQTVSGPKVAYGAVRVLAAIFDTRLTSVADAGCSVPNGYTVHAYTRLDPNNIRRNSLVVWRNSPPAGVNEAGSGINITPADITVSCSNFQFPRFKSNASLRPRYTDMLSSKVYELRTTGTVVHSTSGVTVAGLRVYDSPVIIADQGIVPVTAL